MDKKLQDLAWSLLPKEFKGEVKKLYVEIEVELSKEKGATDNRNWQFRGMKSLLAYLFGKHNLTSDAEGEEMLTVSRKRVQNIYAQCEKIEMDDSPNLPAETVDAASTKMALLTSLFGSKCLPDELNEDNFAKSEPKFKYGIGQKVKSVCADEVLTIKEHCGRVGNDNVYKVEEYAYTWNECELRPYTEPEEPTCTRTCTDDCPSQHKISSVNLSQEIANYDKHFDNVLKDSFRNERRLNIAATITAGVMASPKIIESRNGLKAISDKWLATRTLKLADALIAEAEKGGAVGDS